MPYVVDGLKGNRFKEVAIPKKSDYFARLQGQLREPSDQYFTGDQDLPPHYCKTEMLDAAQRSALAEVRRQAAEDRDHEQEKEEK